MAMYNDQNSLLDQAEIAETVRSLTDVRQAADGAGGELGRQLKSMFGRLAVTPGFDQVTDWIKAQLLVRIGEESAKVLARRIAEGRFRWANDPDAGRAFLVTGRRSAETETANYQDATGLGRKLILADGRFITAPPIWFPNLGAPDAAATKAKVVESESNINYLYYDTTGNITIGIGHKVPNLAAAQGLTLYKLNSSVPSTQMTVTDGDLDATANTTEIESAWNKIVARPQDLSAPHRATHWRRTGDVFMKTADIDTLYEADVTERWGQLEGVFPDLRRFPHPAQDALLDILYQIGIGNLKTRNPRLTRAARCRNWTGCLKALSMNDSRTDRRKKLFDAAAIADDEKGYGFIDPDATDQRIEIVVSTRP